MLKELLDAVEFISPQLNFVSSFLIFLAGGYIALHSRVMPRWAVTCLWYLGMFGLLNALTFLVEWVYGQTHELSHFQIGLATEAFVNTTFAVTVCLLFFHTVWQDYLGAKKRRADAAASTVRQTKAPVKKTPVKPVAKKTKAAGRPAARKVGGVIKGTPPDTRLEL